MQLIFAAVAVRVAKRVIRCEIALYYVSFSKEATSNLIVTGPSSRTIFLTVKTLCQTAVRNEELIVLSHITLKQFLQTKMLGSLLISSFIK
jgi:hypothetical protein